MREAIRQGKVSETDFFVKGQTYAKRKIDPSNLEEYRLFNQIKREEKERFEKLIQLNTSDDLVLDRIEEQDFHFPKKSFDEDAQNQVINEFEIIPAALLHVYNTWKNRKTKFNRGLAQYRDTARKYKAVIRLRVNEYINQEDDPMLYKRVVLEVLRLVNNNTHKLNPLTDLIDYPTIIQVVQTKLRKRPVLARRLLKANGVHNNQEATDFLVRKSNMNATFQRLSLAMKDKLNECEMCGLEGYVWPDKPLRLPRRDEPSDDELAQARILAQDYYGNETTEEELDIIARIIAQYATSRFKYKSLSKSLLEIIDRELADRDTVTLSRTPSSSSSSPQKQVKPKSAERPVPAHEPTQEEYEKAGNAYHLLLTNFDFKEEDEELLNEVSDYIVANTKSKATRLTKSIIDLIATWRRAHPQQRFPDRLSKSEKRSRTKEKLPTKKDKKKTKTKPKKPKNHDELPQPVAKRPEANPEPNPEPRNAKSKSPVVNLDPSPQIPKSILKRPETNSDPPRERKKENKKIAIGPSEFRQVNQEANWVQLRHKYKHLRDYPHKLTSESLKVYRSLVESSGYGTDKQFQRYIKELTTILENKKRK